ncbi:MAG: RNA methyltransferase [Sandaracinaceae bacterium]
MKSIYLALVHHPVKDRAGAAITTAITNLDVHDIARTARTYGLAGYFLVTPLDAQVQLTDAILAHWRTGAGVKRIPERAEALRLVRTCPSIEAARDEVAREAGEAPLLVTTSARALEASELTAYAALRPFDRPILLLFGTGHGLTDDTVRAADHRLPPIRPEGYNHLSVRAAVAITLDRLLGDG